MPRLEFKSETKRLAFNRSHGICECHLIPWLKRPQGCGVRLVTGAINYEHILCNEIRPDNSLENCAVLTRTCWKEKTATYDLPLIAKSDRVQDRARGIKPQHHRPITGSKRSGIALPFRGPPIDRRTGQPWRAGR